VGVNGRRVELRLDTVVLTGFPGGSHVSIVDGLRAALVAALAANDGDGRVALSDRRALDAGAFPVDTSMSARAIGIAAGTAVAKVLR
jgi:hypothetical protein